MNTKFINSVLGALAGIATILALIFAAVSYEQSNPTTSPRIFLITGLAFAFLLAVVLFLVWLRPRIARALPALAFALLLAAFLFQVWLGPRIARALAATGRIPQWTAQALRSMATALLLRRQVIIFAVSIALAISAILLLGGEGGLHWKSGPPTAHNATPTSATHIATLTSATHIATLTSATSSTATSTPTRAPTATPTPTPTPTGTPVVPNCAGSDGINTCWQPNPLPDSGQFTVNITTSPAQPNVLVQLTIHYCDGTTIHNPTTDTTNGNGDYSYSHSAPGGGSQTTITVKLTNRSTGLITTSEVTAPC